MPRRKKSTTPVEKLIVAAMLGIMFSVVMPSLQRTQRRAHTSSQRRTAPVVSRARPEPSGQSNTIEVGDESGRADRKGHGPGAQPIATLMPLVVVAIVVTIILVAVRQGLSRRAQQ